MTQDKPASLKQVTLESLWYVCEEISPNDLVYELKSVLTAVVQGMNVNEQSSVRLAAATTLYNTLNFTLGNNMEKNYIMEALPLLVPMLLETILKQDEDQEDGIWNLSMAGGTCLGLVAKTIGDPIVPLVMPFVQENISKPDWRSREAASYAFGSILEGPSVEHLSPMVLSALDFLLIAMKDQNSRVKDAAAWTLSRIFELLHRPATGFSVISSANLKRIVGVLLESIEEDSPHVAEKVCGAIYYLARGYDEAGSSVLTPYLSHIITSLVVTTGRTDVNDSKLRSAAYKALIKVARCFNLSEPSVIIVQLLRLVMNKLEFELRVISPDDREKHGDLRALLCGVLQVIIQKLSSKDITKPFIVQDADKIMNLLLKVFAFQRSTIHEEAMLAIGVLAYAIGPEFAKYMSEFYRYLEMGLQNFEEYQVCMISVAVVGDICQALNYKMLPYCDKIMALLLNGLSSDDLDRSVKPLLFSCFGDVALAIGEHFEKYVSDAMRMMQGAAEACAQIDVNDEEMVKYGNQLKRSILEAYSGILQGFKNSKAELMLPYAPHLLKFIEVAAKDAHRDKSVVRAAVGVFGDLADTLGSHVKTLFKDLVFCRDLLGECLESEDKQLKETATRTQGMIGRLFSVNEKVPDTTETEKKTDLAVKKRKKVSFESSSSTTHSGTTPAIPSMPGAGFHAIPFDFASMDPIVKELAEQIAKYPSLKQLLKTFLSGEPGGGVPQFVYSTMQQVMQTPQIMNIAKQLVYALLQDPSMSQMLKSSCNPTQKDQKTFLGGETSGGVLSLIHNNSIPPCNKLYKTLNS